MSDSDTLIGIGRTLAHRLIDGGADLQALSAMLERIRPDADALFRRNIAAGAPIEDAFARTFGALVLVTQGSADAIRHLRSVQLDGQRKALGDVGRDILNFINRGSTDIAGMAADIACSGAFQSVAASGIAARTGGDAGRAYREQVRDASNACTPATYVAQQEAATETAWVTGAWIVTGMAALGTAVAVYLMTRPPSGKS